MQRIFSLPLFLLSLSLFFSSHPTTYQNEKRLEKLALLREESAPTCFSYLVCNRHSERGDRAHDHDRGLQLRCRGSDYCYLCSGSLPRAPNNHPPGDRKYLCSHTPKYLNTTARDLIWLKDTQGPGATGSGGEI